MKRDSVNKVQVRKFRPGLFASNIIPKLLIKNNIVSAIWKPTFQIEYLDRYLNSIHAKRLVIENIYVDRHYMTEYQTYYSTCVNAPSNKCIRLHAFCEDFFQNDLVEAVNSINNTSNENVSNRDDFIKKLANSYLGYIVLRPVADALVGRTMLKPSLENQGKYINTIILQDVHLLGLCLQIGGLPFQQQDLRVGACATTAVWSALSKIAKTDGFRAPTPAEITESARRSYIPFGLDHPPGLTEEQICEAIRSLGFRPRLISVTGKYLNTIKSLISSYLKSGIPVIMCIAKDQESEDGHAVTCCGILQDYNIPHEIRDKRILLSAWEKIYFHDDRLGPYAKGSILSKGKYELLVDDINCFQSLLLKFKYNKDKISKFIVRNLSSKISNFIKKETNMAMPPPERQQDFVNDLNYILKNSKLWENDLCNQINFTSRLRCKISESDKYEKEELNRHILGEAYPREIKYISNEPSIYLEIPILNDNGEVQYVEKNILNFLIIPNYTKLRVTSESLLEFGMVWLDHLIKQSSDLKSDLSLEYYFKRSGDISEDIRKLSIIDNDKYKFISSLVLSRYVGVVDIKYKIDTLLLKFLFDTTDILTTTSAIYPSTVIPDLNLDQLIGVIFHRIIKDTDWKIYIEYFEKSGVPTAYN